MKSLTFGVVPADLEIDSPYPMSLNPADLATVAEIVNVGIDSHLEAVFTRQRNDRVVEILDSASMRTFLRRCAESGDEGAESLASGIMGTLGYEWV